MYSVIIPVYNSEHFIKRCVSSIINQNNPTEFEVLLIDDGSTDGSGALCDAIAKTDSRIRVFHQENKGVSATRNAGLEHAKGEYVLFVDSDDFLVEGAFAVLEEHVSRFQPDVLVFEINCVRENIITYTSQLEDRFSKTPAETRLLLSEIYERGNIASCVNKLYKRSFIGNIRFCEDVRYGEDLLFNLQLFTEATHICTIDKALYSYDQHNDSLSTNVTERLIDEMLILYSASDSFFDKLGVEKSEKERLLTAHYFNYLYPFQISCLSRSPLLSYRQKISAIRKICQTPYGNYCLKNQSVGLFNKLIARRKYFLILAYCRLLHIFKRS